MVLLVGTIFAFTQISDTITLEKIEKDTLISVGINAPVISSCIKIDDYHCKVNIYEKGGINKDIEITQSKNIEDLKIFNEVYKETALRNNFTPFLFRICRE